MKIFNGVLRGAVVAISLTCALQAQTPDTAILNGQVQDTTHAAISGAAVQVTNDLTGLTRSTTTDAKGNFTLSGLPVAGTYEVESEKSGFATATVQHVS